MFLGTCSISIILECISYIDKSSSKQRKYTQAILIHKDSLFTRRARCPYNQNGTCRPFWLWLVITFIARWIYRVILRNISRTNLLLPFFQKNIISLKVTYFFKFKSQRSCFEIICKTPLLLSLHEPSNLHISSLFPMSTSRLLALLRRPFHLFRLKKHAGFPKRRFFLLSMVSQPLIITKNATFENWFSLILTHQIIYF